MRLLIITVVDHQFLLYGEAMHTETIIINLICAVTTIYSAQAHDARQTKPFISNRRDCSGRSQYGGCTACRSMVYLISLVVWRRDYLHVYSLQLHVDNYTVIYFYNTRVSSYFQCEHGLVLCSVWFWHLRQRR